VTTDPDIANPWERWSWLLAAVWLVFLVYPILEVLQTDLSTPVQVLGVALCLVFGLVYVLGFSVLDDRPWLVTAALLLLVAALVPIIGVEVIGLTPYLGMWSALQIPSPWWPWTTGVIALTPLISLFAEDFPLFFFLMVWPIIAVGVLIRLFAMRGEQHQATLSALALVAERDRVARDVHDVLGHSLTALSIKAELATRLVEVDPARAKAELESIQEIARQALTEVRATVGGLRAANLEAELTAAPLVLADAGIETNLVGTVADTDPRHRALLAWVLRESVTNVVRHASADSVVIELQPRGLSVTDDGAGITGREGNGVRGMRERVASAGGTLTLHDAAPGTRVQVTLP
jgi:two-component system sensor histidine kinase DesK